MSQIIKPRNPVINWGNPLTKNLIFAPSLSEIGGTTAKDLFSGVNGNLNTAAAWKKDKYGSMINLPDGNSWIGWPAGFNTGGSPFTVFALINPTSVATANQTILGTNQNGAITLRLSTNTLDVVFTNLVDLGASTGTISANVWSFVGATYAIGGLLNYYINGVNAGSLTNNQAFGGGVPQIGANAAGAINQQFTGNIAIVYLWHRVLSPQEIKSLSTNPFQIYQQPKFAFANLLSAFKWQPLTENLQPNHHLMRWEVIEY